MPRPGVPARFPEAPRRRGQVGHATRPPRGGAVAGPPVAPPPPTWWFCADAEFSAARRPPLGSPEAAAGVPGRPRPSPAGRPALGTGGGGRIASFRLSPPAKRVPGGDEGVVGTPVTPREVRRRSPSLSTGPPWHASAPWGARKLPSGEKKGPALARHSPITRPSLIPCTSFTVPLTCSRPLFMTKISYR